MSEEPTSHRHVFAADRGVREELSALIDRLSPGAGENWEQKVTALQHTRQQEADKLEGLLVSIAAKLGVEPEVREFMACRKRLQQQEAAVLRELSYIQAMQDQTLFMREVNND